MKEFFRIILVTLNIFFLARSLTCSGNTPLYQKLNLVESCVKQCDSSLIEFTADNTCKLLSMCTLYISSDNKKCTASCGLDYVNLSLSPNQIYKRCSQKCDSEMYIYFQNSIKYCHDTCPSNYLTNYSSFTCLANVKDCGFFVAFDKNVCKENCDESQNEIVVMQNGMNFCYKCYDFFIPSTSDRKASCAKTCPADYIGSMKDMRCYLLSTAATSGCKNLKISSDQKTCNDNCPFNDITNINGDCVAPCTTPGCSKCPHGQAFIQYDNWLKCIESEFCEYYLSSDEESCIFDCKFIEEVAAKGSVKKCTKCPEGTVSHYSSNGMFFCKPPGQLTNDEKDPSIQLTRAIKYHYLVSYGDIQFVSNKINGQILKHYQELTSSSNIQSIFKIIEGYQKLFISQTDTTLLGSDPILFGSNSTIMLFYQFLRDHRQLINPFNMKSLLEGSQINLTEQKNKLEQETASSVTVQIIASNPACKARGCEKYPIIQIQTQQKPVSNRRMLASIRTFHVEFTVAEPSSKYICLNYNLETSEVVCPYTLPIASDNGLTLTCEVSGATQLFLDSSDIFISMSDCAPSPTPTQSSTPTPNQKDGGSSGISTGGVFGIVIGTLGGSIFFSVGGFILYKKLSKIKVINYDVKLPQPVPNTGLIAEPKIEP